MKDDGSTRVDYTMTIKEEDIQCQQNGYILHVQHESLSDEEEDDNSCDCQDSMYLKQCMIDQSCGGLCFSVYKHVESIADNVDWRYCEIEFF